MPIPNRTTRAGALALAGLTAASVAPAAFPEPAEGPARLPLANVTSLVPLQGVRARPAVRIATPRLAQGASRLAPAELPASIERVTEAVLRNQGAGRFPVAGEFNWGQEGARFGAGRGGRPHAGQDVFGRTGTPLLAVSDSVVVEADADGGRGNYVGLYDPARRRTYVYLHLQRPSRVRPGRRLVAGERVGELGCTGSCSGDHLHFEVRRGRGLDGQPDDPLPHLLRWSRVPAARATLPPGAR